ncbi:MAG: DUF1343 domain-containing protein [Leptospiraceae bacterium]|nr:DUF1343 domain-containing protein [Leptospiraceae bacterium]
MNSQKLFKKFKNSRAGIFTNQSGFGGLSGWKYHFEYFKKYLSLDIIFLPEHGLFAELQDQVSGSGLQYDYGKTKIVNLYGDEESSLLLPKHVLKDLDVIIIDIKDVGARYYTFLTSAFYILKTISEWNSSEKNKVEVIVIHHENPIGLKVEGSPLQKKYESFVGVTSVPHRHGLNGSELLQYYVNEFYLDVDLYIADDFMDVKWKFWVPPSPNIPTVDTCYVYPGQCLLEGTNLSEGRGTTRPFEIFGAPFINIQDKLLLSQLELLHDGSFVLRPLFFQPTFHKHKEKICGGFQIIVLEKKKFHSLLTSLGIIKIIKDFYPDNFEFLKGPYEFRSDLTAIELLSGDDTVLEFLNGKISLRELKDYFRQTEMKWEQKISDLRS